MDKTKKEAWLAPAMPNGPRLTHREGRIVDAFNKGADPAALIRNYHTPPAVLFKILGLNPGENAAVFAQLQAEYNDLDARALR